MADIMISPGSGRTSREVGTVIAIPSDTHCGSSVGLMPPGTWRLASGGYIIPNRIQTIIQRQWHECWQRVAELRRNRRLIIIHAGDATEGLHHDSPEIVSPRIDEHVRIHVVCMRQAMETSRFDPRSDRLLYVSGTPTHVASGAVNEELIARLLGAVPQVPGTLANDYQDGRYIWDHLRFRTNGVLFDIAHHGPPPGSRSWLRGNSLRWSLRSIYFDCLENGLEIPRYWVRAHRHRWVMPEAHRGEKGTIEGFLTPCFQAKTEFGHKVANAEVFSHIGMLIFVVEPGGQSAWHCPRLKIQQDDVVTL